MYTDSDLTNHLQTSSVVELKSKIIAEWNLNIFENLDVIGNYFYRHDTASSRYVSTYATLPTTFVLEDENTTNPRYYGGTDYDTVIDGGYEEDGSTPAIFLKQNDQQKLLMSLESCFTRFRPRSGINKLRFNSTKQIPPTNETTYSRPRYYVAGKDDIFKYWSSYRRITSLSKPSDTEIVGFSYDKSSEFLIEDVAPFVKYKNSIPANRVVIKVQTNVGDIKLDLKPDGTNDPFWSGSATNNKSTPVEWKLEKLVDTTWTTVYNGGDDFPTDGYLELSYGITNIPVAYTNNFKLIDSVSSNFVLPNLSDKEKGFAYLLKATNQSIGTLHIWDGDSWEQVVPTYGWYKNTQTMTNTQQYVTDFIVPKTDTEDRTDKVDYYMSNSTRVYRQFDYLDGLRLSVTKMKNSHTTIALIELSPRLTADISDIVVSYSIKKMASDIGLTSLPVGQLLASTGQMSLFDFSQAFNQNNKFSILNKYAGDELQFTFASKNLQLKFYESVISVPVSSSFKDYMLPVKTMYTDGYPQYDNANREVTFNLRDLSFYFESISAPRIMLNNATLSKIIATLLDNVGFTNYIFKRAFGEYDPVIPYFFVPPDKTIMEVLNDLATSTQTAMFFDEDNNFVCMSKQFLVPETSNVRDTSITLYGDDSSNGIKANIINLKGENKDIFNDGKVIYKNRYIQKSISSLTQASKLDKDRIWRYKPVLLWEVSGEQTTKSINEELSTESNYVLSAVRSNAVLRSSVPQVNNKGQIVNNIIEFGDGVYWLSRYNGYFYANGEIIKYDAIQYNVTSPNSPISITSANNSSIVSVDGEVTFTASTNHNLQVGDEIVIMDVVPIGYRGVQTITAVPNLTQFKFKTTTTGAITTSGTAYLNNEVFITSTEDYQKYFASLPAGGRMYPTGKVRIYAEPRWTRDGKLKEGDVAKHGRGQFGTTITNHLISSNITDWQTSTIKSTLNDYQFLFNVKKNENTGVYTNVFNEEKSTNITENVSALTKLGTATYAIKNYLSTLKYNMSTQKYDTSTDMLQSSSLVFSGAGFVLDSSASASINRITKNLTSSGSKYDTFGTRMRIIGNKESSSSKQFPNGSIDIYSLTNSKNKTTVLGGSSGGMSFYTNAAGEGYYYEIIALTDSNPILTGITSTSDIYNVLFYKLVAYEITKDNIAGSLSGDIFTASSAISGVTAGDYVRLTGQSPSTENGNYVALSSTKLQKTNGVLKPILLSSSLRSIITDDGQFVGQGRVSAEQNPTVYDLSVQAEQELTVRNGRRFYIYLNNNLIDTVEDTSPLSLVQNVGLFIRGSSKIMFENVFAVDTTANNTEDIKLVNSIFRESSATISTNRYALSGILQSTALSGIRTTGKPAPTIYYEEFGTIMREMAYFNVRFEKAYPALFSKIAPTFTGERGYVVSGYNDNPYGAEFLVFNATDSALSLDATSGNYLRILGIAFTQESTHDLTVDEYYLKRSDLSYNDGLNFGEDPNSYKKQYTDIKNSRLTYGTKSFTIDSPYIQNYDTAYRLMDWTINKLRKPRQVLGIDVFGLPILQLGDIVQINYTNPGSDVFEVSPNSKFLVYGIEHSKNETGLSMLVYVSEVV